MIISREIKLKSPGAPLKGVLSVPENPVGLVIFAHGSGSSRFSPRNTFVSNELNADNIATLLMDLLTEEEEADRANVFNISLLSGRLVAATKWVRSSPELENLPIGYFGASTGAAAALAAAAESPDAVKAVVSRGGRPDLAMESLSRVGSPTLLIVGGADYDVIGMNRVAFDKIKAEKNLAVIPGATHLFEESGALKAVSDLASAWFVKYFTVKK